ncbi:MAG: hypothetical protein LBL07_02825 [Tannerella sp.]|jgi:hypothetical protein|nr:hypothetical protein [Tannerella sp.]
MIRTVKIKILEWATVLAGMISVGIFMQSCNSEIGIMETADRNSKVISTWQKQIDYVLNGLGAEKFALQNLQLVHYKVIDDMDVSVKSWASEKLSDESVVPVYNDSLDINRFELLPVSGVNNFDANGVKEVYSDVKKQIICNFPDSYDLKIVELTWNYQGKPITSKCLVNDTCVIYDDILSNIRYITVEEAEEPDTVKIPRLKTGNESSPDGPISYNFRSPTYTTTNWIGTLCAEAWCSISVSGNSSNNIKSISTYVESAHYWADGGYTATAQITVTSFAPGAGGHCSYQYAVATGSSGSVTVSWNGNSYSISGGGHGQSGGAYIDSSSLN